MATEKERSLVHELSNLAMDINAQGELNATVDISASGLHLRISKVPFDNSDPWVFYGDHSVYFSNDEYQPEESFVSGALSFIDEAKKHHPASDADGVKL